jgi:transcriptional regulator with XRE-family HTH domain
MKSYLEKFGNDLRNARTRRRIQQIAMAKALGVSLPTLRKAEKGDPTVAFGVYAAYLTQLGFVERLADLADARHDKVGLSLENERLPKRIGRKKLASGDDAA